MATDIEPEPSATEDRPTRPNLKITGLHIRNLKSIAALDLPADGLGWSGPMPDMLMIGGVNGSGKTTLLDFIAGAFEFVEIAIRRGPGNYFPPSLMPQEGWIDFEWQDGSSGEMVVRFVCGNVDFLSRFVDLNPENEAPEAVTFTCLVDTAVGTVDGAGLLCRVGDRAEKPFVGMTGRQLVDLGTVTVFLDGGPSIVSIPSENRALVIHQESYKFPGRISAPERFVQRWSPPKDWKETIEARLYALRWADLNDKEEGRPEDAVRFIGYTKTVDRFFGERKKLKWHRGELVVEVKGGATHDLSGLSSGEKQVILFMGELLYRWTPGSLILIDEPELHLHEIYQSTLWSTLEEWQVEKGGQVIVATQSSNLYTIGDPDIKVLLTRGPWS